MRQVAFDRMLARLFHAGSEELVLKGGYSLELRTSLARSTRDMDLSMTAARYRNEEPVSPVEIHICIQSACAIPLGDGFAFEVRPAIFTIEGVGNGGARLPVTVTLGGRTFARFHVDVVSGESPTGPTDLVTAHDWLGFAGIAPPRVRCISCEQQFAEKLHAYTMPNRPHPNSRVKDLVDMVLLITRLNLDPGMLIATIEGTFESRKSHVLKEHLEPPPRDWKIPFAQMASETHIDPDIEAAFILVRDFVLRIPRGSQRGSR